MRWGVRPTPAHAVVFGPRGHREDRRDHRRITRGACGRGLLSQRRGVAALRRGVGPRGRGGGGVGDDGWSRHMGGGDRSVPPGLVRPALRAARRRPGDVDAFAGDASRVRSRTAGPVDNALHGLSKLGRHPPEVVARHPLRARREGGLRVREPAARRRGERPPGGGVRRGAGRRRGGFGLGGVEAPAEGGARGCLAPRRGHPVLHPRRRRRRVGAGLLPPLARDAARGTVIASHPRGRR
mmetsp:Transcript_42334/g.113255  ORF Transcript_42334/g.113255 Transcript_42334/m.113255 type:complete len:239 (-) Transcript_42334:1051-1767(-)